VKDIYIIQALKLHKYFGETRAVDGISLQIKAGEIYGLVGSDGAGKTTTMRLIVGALRADSGECSINGFNIEKKPEEAHAQLGYLSQRFSLYEELTVLENIRFFAEVRGLKSKEWLPRCMEILKFVGLADYKDRRAGQLSGGMKQKLGLATALVTRPRVLLLDEPTTGVDPVTRQDFWQLLVQLTSGFIDLPSAPGEGSDRNDVDNVAVLISTPYMDEAGRCHRVGFMRHGQIIAEGTPSQLRARLDGRVLELRGSPLKLLRRISQNDPDVEDVRAFGDRLHLRVVDKKAEIVLKRLQSHIREEGAKIDGLRVIPPVLEDIFIELSEQSYE
jgi:ABC-2 type transport system ATP-binding protein